MQHEVLSHRVSLRLELAPALPPVLGDRVQLQQVIINLVSTACRPWLQSPTGARTADPLAAGRRPIRCLVAVEDCGIGIDRREREQFVQRLLHHQAQRNGHGTIDLPLDHRSPWRTDVRRQQFRAGGDVSIYPAGGSGRLGVTTESMIPEKLQGFRISMIRPTNTWSEIAIQSGRISLRSRASRSAPLVSAPDPWRRRSHGRAPRCSPRPPTPPTPRAGSRPSAASGF